MKLNISTSIKSVEHTEQKKYHRKSKKLSSKKKKELLVQILKYKRIQKFRPHEVQGLQVGAWYEYQHDPLKATITNITKRKEMNELIGMTRRKN